jgi:hypothetical protein
MNPLFTGQLFEVIGRLARLVMCFCPTQQATNLSRQLRSRKATGQRSQGHYRLHAYHGRQPGANQGGGREAAKYETIL